MYLARNKSDGLPSPTSIRSVLLAVVDDLQLLDADNMLEVVRIIKQVFGEDLAGDISLDVGRKGQVIISTNRELVPLVKLRVSQLKSRLEEVGITGEVRIVVDQKATGLR